MKIPDDYKPSVQKPTIYTGPDLPITYDPDWQYFTNLTAAQIAAFQAFPEWEQKVVDHQALLQSMGMATDFSPTVTLVTTRRP